MRENLKRMSDNVNVLIEKMNQESLKKRQAAQQKKYGIHEAKTGGNVIGGSEVKAEGDEDAANKAGGAKGAAGNSATAAGYGSVDAAKSQGGIETAGGEVIVGSGAKGKAGGATSGTGAA